ncbi:putative Ileal sodium/bile acid cotransporter [Senna tora]|uniref:Putative Ileal sodium/bile acid cotransporter n=1 Tax=Senna tora TaxID=362788 RepID=A0A834STN3_9FABA|nr:putative Ileal sodium/bile acid cotransporter [Senna tora]
MIYNYWRSRSHPQDDHNNLTIIPSCIITRMRCFTATHNLYYSNGYLLPMYANNVCSLEIEENWNIPPSSSLSKTFIGLAFQAGLVMFQIQNTISSASSPSSSKDEQSYVFRASMVIAFAASLSGSFLIHAKPRISRILEKTSRLCFAMGFFVMCRVFLGGSWVMCVIEWLSGGFTMVAFLMLKVSFYLVRDVVASAI